MGEILCEMILGKIVELFQLLLKSDKHNGYCVLHVCCSAHRKNKRALYRMTYSRTRQRDCFAFTFLCKDFFLKNKNQLNATYYFIVLLIGSTCFGHYCAQHQELATIMLITTLVVSFYKDGRGSVNVKLWFQVAIQKFKDQDV